MMLPDTAQRRMVLRSIAGSPLTVLVSMLLFPSSHGEAQIAADCGLNRRTVRNALISLEGLGFVMRDGRYEAWIISAAGRQFVLSGQADQAVEPAAVEADAIGVDVEDGEFTEDGEGEKISSGSSSILSVHVSDIASTPKQQQQQQGGVKCTLPPQLEVAYDALLDLRCSPDRAYASLVRACEFWEEAGVAREVGLWAEYCRSDEGGTIRQPGFFVAKRIEQGIECSWRPAKLSREDQARAYLAEYWDNREV